MRITIRHLFLFTFFVAVMIPPALWTQQWFHPPATPVAVRLLSEFNRWDANELYLYNNSNVARKMNYMVSGESNGHISTKVEQLAKTQHPVEWNNKARVYRFKFNKVE